MTRSRVHTELDDLFDDPREAARKRLERRRAVREEGEREAHLSRSSRATGADDLPRSVAHADLLGSSNVVSSGRTRRAHASSSAGMLSIPRLVLVLAGALVLVGLFAGVGLVERSCSAGPEKANPVQAEPVDQSTEESPEQTQAPEQADAANLPASLAPEYASALMERAATDERAVHVVNGAPALAEALGENEQLKMLKLAAEEPEALDFVANMADSYPAPAGSAYDGQVTQGEIPLLMQWDARWGYTGYCGSSFASAGCCPTSLSMVYMGLTGKTDKTPYDMGQLAVQGGYAVDYEGTIGDFLTAAAPDLGLVCERFSPSAASLGTYLESGYTVVCNVGPGLFTTTGHFFVITGVADDGTLEINDPYSAVRSAKTWDVDTVVGQTIAFYGFKAA